MLMAELSRRSGVPVATIKYYQREGLLPPGTPIAATRTEYGEVHLRRLRLVRTLVELGEVPLAAIGRILAAVDDESVSLHDMLGRVQYSLGPQQAGPGADDQDVRAVDELIAELGWNVTSIAPARTLLAASLAGLRRSGAVMPAAGLRGFAEVLGVLAEQEVATLEQAAAGSTDRVALSEAAVTGIVLFERVIIALRRLAQEDASARRYSPEAPGIQNRNGI